MHWKTCKGVRENLRVLANSLAGARSFSNCSSSRVWRRHFGVIAHLAKMRLSGCTARRRKKRLTAFALRQGSRLPDTIPRLPEIIASFAEAPNMDRQILLQQLAQAEQ